jgi:peptide/nickel transport system permease protein
MIYVFGIRLNWLPIIYTSPPESFWMGVKQVIMPVICLSVPAIAGIARQMRSSMLEVIRQDYIRTAWSKGLSERTVIMRHALKNALIPVVTIVGAQLPILVGGAVVEEQIFALPGVGRYLIDAINRRDYPIISGVNLIIATVILFSNLLIDLIYAWLDPRIQYQ